MIIDYYFSILNVNINYIVLVGTYYFFLKMSRKLLETWNNIGITFILYREIKKYKKLAICESQ